jgi:quinol monooxygenase YgiN
MEGKDPHCPHPSHPKDCDKPSDTKHCEHSEQVDVVAILRIKPESIEAARPTVEKLIEETRKEEGNVRYDWYQDSKEAGTFVVLETFKSLEAFQKHNGSDHLKSAGEKFKEWCSHPTEVRVLKPVYVAKQ